MSKVTNSHINFNLRFNHHITNAESTFIIGHNNYKFKVWHTEFEPTLTHIYGDIVRMLSN